jgi:DNA-binding FadR family transcriptional regulator
MATTRGSRGKAAPAAGASADAASAAAEPRQKGAIRLAQEIARIIHDEGLQPGDRYLSEADALKRHGVARATFREALRFLEIQGVVRVRAGPGGGAVVSRPDWPNLASTLALLLQFADAPLRQVLEARCVLEPGMAELAARNASEAEIAAMGGDIAQAKASLGDYEAFSVAYRSYWSRLARSTQNALLAFLSPALRAIVDSGGFIPDELQRQKLVERLSGLHAAVAARDGPLARQRLAEIEDAFLERLATGYPQRIARPVVWSDVKGAGS